MDNIPFSDEELVDISGGRQENTGHEFTLDPNVRLGYIKSLGNVKKVQMQGHSLIKDADSMQGRRNSLDGYEMFVVPEKQIAILEKLYETTRDADGNVVYATNLKGEEIPAIECETYFMPLDMAREFWESQNKREMLRRPLIEKAYHTSNWTQMSDVKMKRIALGKNFDKDAILKESDDRDL